MLGFNGSVGSSSITGTTVSVLLICALLAVAFDGAEVRTRRGDRIPRLSKPEQRADALLKEWLSPEQRSTLHKYGFFEVRGSHTGKCYRIRRGRNMNIYEVGTGQTAVVPHFLYSWAALPERLTVLLVRRG